jgi:hypothetical protein
MNVDLKLRYFDDVFGDLDRAQKLIGHVFQGVFQII